MPLLAGLLVTLFGGLVDFFLRFATKRLAMATAAVALVGGAWATAYVAVQGLVVGLSYTLPATLAHFFPAIFPANAAGVVAGFFAVDAVVSALKLYWSGVSMGLRF